MKFTRISRTLALAALFAVGAFAQVISQPQGSGGGGGTGPAGATGSTGPAGPAPSGTGYVHVTGGTLDTPSNTLSTPSIGATPITESFVAGTGGTIANTLVKTDASFHAITILTSDTGAYGVAMASVSATAAVEVARVGTVNCLADNTTIIGDLVIAGTGTAGYCSDSGQTSSSAISISTRIIGVFRSAVAGGALASVELLPSHFGTSTGFTDNGTTVSALSGRNLSVGTRVLAQGSDSYVDPMLALKQSAQMPRAGLITEYTMNQAAGRFALNGVYPEFPEYNLLEGFSEQAFSASSWNPASVTVTDNFGLNPVGEFTASRILGAGTGTHALYISAQHYTSGVTYVGSVWVMSNTGSAQAMRLDVAGTLSSDIVVPTTWTRVYFSHSASASTAFFAPIWSDVAGDAIDILIWGVQLETGTVPTTYVPQNGQLVSMVSGAPSSTAINWQSAGVLFNGTSTTVGNVFAQTQKLSATTIYMAVQKTGSYAAGYIPLLSPMGSSDWSNLALWPEGTNGTIPYDFEFTFNAQPLINPLGSLEDNQWHIVVATYDGATLRIMVDGNEVVQKAQVIAATSFTNIQLAGWITHYWPGYIGYAAIYNLGHTPEQAASNTAIISSLMASRGVSIPATPKYLTFEGDSLTDVQTAPTSPNDGYVYIASHALSGAAYLQPGAFATSGSFIATVVARAAIVDSALSSSPSMKKLEMVLIGTNDIADSGFSASSFVASLKAYCLARKAANPGLKIVASTLPSNTANQTHADSANTLIRADSSYYDALADFAANGTIGCTGCAANATYFSDGVHPTAAGQAIMATIAQSAITTALP